MEFRDTCTLNCKFKLYFLYLKRSCFSSYYITVNKSYVSSKQEGLNVKTQLIFFLFVKYSIPKDRLVAGFISKRGAFKWLGKYVETNHRFIECENFKYVRNISSHSMWYLFRRNKMVSGWCLCFSLIVAFKI